MACIRKIKRNACLVLDFYDQFGERQRVSLPKGTTKAKAREKLREIEEQVSRGIYITEKKTPFFKDVVKDWLAHKKPNIRITTYEVMEGHTRNHFDIFMSQKVNRITTGDIEKYIASKRQAEMNINTLRKVLVTLNQIMAYAVRHGFIDHNPVRDAERPREQFNGEEKSIDVLNIEQIKSFLESVEDREYRTLFMLAIMSGARQGELLGLKWSDIDWENSQIFIQRTFNKGRWFSPKTKGSKRKVDIGPAMIKALLEWKLACPPNNLNLIFPNKSGEAINYSNMVQRYYQPALKKADLPRMKFHCLRHTFASLLLDQGENVKYVQTQLGHSSPTVTLNVYTHLMKPTNQKAASRLESAVFS